MTDDLKQELEQEQQELGIAIERMREQAKQIEVEIRRSEGAYLRGQRILERLSGDGEAETVAETPTGGG